MRSLESEVRDLKNLLDEKDEKIDVLSRIHSFSPASQHKSVTSLRPAAVEPVRPAVSDTERCIKVQRPSSTAEETRLAGLSSTRCFAGKFSRAAEEMFV